MYNIAGTAAAGYQGPMNTEIKIESITICGTEFMKALFCFVNQINFIIFSCEFKRCLEIQFGFVLKLQVHFSLSAFQVSIGKLWIQTDRHTVVGDGIQSYCSNFDLNGSTIVENFSGGWAQTDCLVKIGYCVFKSPQIIIRHSTVTVRIS